ncbi:MAG: phosphatidylglycerophosphatase A [Sulfurimicrobium sp.]|nr:phosphatidylglycerophosphatase A [Sulfurimicrobium sp.]
MTILRNKPDLKLLFSHPAHFFSLGFGSGLSPFAPGTAGSLLAIPLFMGLAHFLPLAGLLAVVMLSFGLGVWFCGLTGKALGVSDHGGIVWDEIVAMWLILAFTPPGWLWFGIAFLLFRLFDIWKPFPIRYFDQHVKGGFGVMLDDLLAAGYALAVLKLLEHFYG